MTGDRATATVPDAPATGVGIGVLQAEVLGALRGEHSDPVHAALAPLGRHFAAVHVAFQSEAPGRRWRGDWSWDGFAGIDGLRESIGTAIVDVMRVRCARAIAVGGDAVILTAPIFDANQEIIGAASAVIGSCAEPTLQLAAFEAAVGFVALALDAHERSAGRELRLALPEAVKARANDALFLAYAMVAELRNRRGLDQVFLGYVRRGRARVMAVSGIDEVREGNPSVKLVTAAMEECLDRGQAVLHPTADAHSHLHAAWSRSAAGDVVVSFPLLHDSEIVAVVSVRVAAEHRLTPGDVQGFQRDLQPFAWLVPVSRLASRSVVAHVLDGARQLLARALGGRNLRAKLLLCGALALVAWVAFGSIRYGFTVPCSVVPEAPRTVSCPREGILREVLVGPGDRVRAGQLLARFDTEEDLLEAASARADMRRLGAMIDRARAQAKPGDVGVFTAQREAAAAGLGLLLLRIARAELRAPHSGTILAGDLSRMVGARVPMGQPLFQMARGDRVQVELRIPENHVWDAREFAVATFAPTARPAERLPLDAVTVHPSSVAADGRNEFLARSNSFVPPAHLTPGMEGVVHVDAGDRSVWWVLSHRITDWMRLRFWF